MGIKPVIKPGRNARTDRSPPEKRFSTIIFKRLWGKKWSRLVDYGGRWRQRSQHSNAYTENTPCQKTWRP